MCSKSRFFSIDNAKFFAWRLIRFLMCQKFSTSDGDLIKHYFTPLMHVQEFGVSIVDALKPVIIEKLSHHGKNVQDVFKKLAFDEKIKREFVERSFTVYGSFNELDFNNFKRQLTRNFNGFFYYYQGDNPEVLENIDTIFEAMKKCLKDPKFEQLDKLYFDKYYEFEDECDVLFEYYYIKEINNKESNNESKKVSSEETNNNNEKNGERSNVIDQFEFQIFNLRTKSFSTRRYRFCDFQRIHELTRGFDNSLYFKNLKEFVRNVFSCERYNENTVLKNFCEEICPEREIKRFAEFTRDFVGGSLDFEYEIFNIKKKLTSNFNKLYKTFYKDRKVILENLDKIFNPIINQYKKDVTFKFKVNRSDSNDKDQENEKLNEEKSNVIKQFEFQIFDLRVKSFSTRQHKFCGHGNRFDEVLYFKNLKEFVRNVFLCELYNENTVLKNFYEKIYPAREIKRFVKPSFYDEITDTDFRIKINKEWYKETLIIKKKLTSNFNKLYKTFYKDRWLILENLDEIFDPIINDYKKDSTFQLKENHSEINGKDQENEINENESNNELEVPSEEINNNNDKDQENETNENENNNTKKDPWFFIIRNAKVEVGV